MKSDPVITYNHMEDEHSASKTRQLKKPLSGKLVYLVEFALLAALLLLMFYLF